MNKGLALFTIAHIHCIGESAAWRKDAMGLLYRKFEFSVDGEYTEDFELCFPEKEEIMKRVKERLDEHPRRFNRAIEYMETERKVAEGAHKIFMRSEKKRRISHEDLETLKYKAIAEFGNWTKYASREEQAIMWDAGPAIRKITEEDFDFSKGPYHNPVFLGYREEDIPDLKTYRMYSIPSNSILRIIIDCCKKIIGDGWKI